MRFGFLLNGQHLVSGKRLELLRYADILLKLGNLVKTNDDRAHR